MTYKVDLIQNMAVCMKDLVNLGCSDPIWEYRPYSDLSTKEYTPILLVRAKIEGEYYEMACAARTHSRHEWDPFSLESLRSSLIRPFERTLRDFDTNSE
jgi:hypothetical protein